MNITGPRRIVLRVIALLWVIWGAVHILAGVMTLGQTPPKAFAGIADAVDPALLDMTYPAAVVGVLHQHGFNLLWFGGLTLLGGIWLFRGRAWALVPTAVIGALADIGYFVFIDLPGFARFMPGTVMTIVSGAAVVLTAWLMISARGEDAGEPAMST